MLLFVLVMVIINTIAFVIEASPPIQEYDGYSMNSLNCSY